jgi:hypothetical protein
VSWQWRQSGIETMLQCPEKFRRLNVEREHDMNSASNLMGTAVHEAIAYALMYLKFNGDYESAGFIGLQAQDAFRELVENDRNGQDPIPWRDGSLEDRLDEVDRMAAALWDQMPGILERWGAPLSIEQPFSDVPSGIFGITFQGTWDLLTDKHVLIDWKTSTKPWPKYKAPKKVQPLVYARAVEHLTGRWPEGFVFVVVTREGRVQQIPVNVSRERYVFLERTLPELERMRLNGIYPLNADSALCSPDYCPFYNRGCPAKELKELA